MRLRLLGNRALIAPIEPKVEMPEGLVAPDSALPPAETAGHVEQLPDGYHGPVQVGDVVCFSNTVGQEIVFAGQRKLVIPVPDILAVLT